MRLIRDIINEKRANSKFAQPAAEAEQPKEDMSSPYVLRSPVDDSADDQKSDMSPSLTDSEPMTQSKQNDAMPDSFFKKAAELSKNPDMNIYEDDEAASALPTSSRLESKFNDDDDEDYDNDDPDFDADAWEAEFDLDDFTPNAAAEEAAAALNKPDPFDRLEAAQQKATPKSEKPSPLNKMDWASPTYNNFEGVPAAAQKPVAATPSAPVEELKPVGGITDDAPVDMPAPAAGRGSNRSGRVKTRLLGFSAGTVEQEDPLAQEESKSDGSFPVGWLVVVSEMGRGSAYSIHDGVSKVGRGTDQTVSLNFGDNSISRENHISIAYDAEQNKFFIGHSGKTNLVRINNMPLLSTQELFSKDLIRLGETTLRFVALCQADFSWNETEEKVARHA